MHAQALVNLHLAPFPRPATSLVEDFPSEQGHKGWMVCLLCTLDSHPSATWHTDLQLHSLMYSGQTEQTAGCWSAGHVEGGLLDVFVCCTQNQCLVSQVLHHAATRPCHIPAQIGCRSERLDVMTPVSTGGLHST